MSPSGHPRHPGPPEWSQRIARGGPVGADTGLHRPDELVRIAAQLEAIAYELRLQGSAIDDQLRGPLAALERNLVREAEAVLGQPVHEEVAALFSWLGNPSLSCDEVRLGLAELLGWVQGLLGGVRFVSEPGSPSLQAEMAE